MRRSRPFSAGLLTVLLGSGCCGSCLDVAPPIVPSLVLRDAELRAGGKTLLSAISSKLVLETSDPRGAFLHAETANVSSSFEVELGSICCQRFMACSRQKLWWMYPNWGKRSADIRPETQFLLLELPVDTSPPPAAQGAAGSAEDSSHQRARSSPAAGDPRYAVILPLVSGAFRSSLKSSSTWSDNSAVLCVESGDPNVSVCRVENVLFVAAGDDPFALLERAFRAVADRLQVISAMCSLGVYALSPLAFASLASLS